jgi:TatD DNase family protein
MNSTYIDTHCHLNFKRFKKDYDTVIKHSLENGIQSFIVPGTDILLSQKAIEIASKYENIFAAVGIHPHHTFINQKLKIEDQKLTQFENDMAELEKMLIHPKVVAVGEVGLDSHEYEETKYQEYHISEEFMNAQKEYFRAEIHLAEKYKKALIIHNRETKKELLEILNSEWNEEMCFRTVFHCCEPDQELLAYAILHNIFIGVDGDVTYGGEKAEFAKEIPLELLVLETDSPFLLPEPLKSQKLYPNTPANIPIIATYIAELKGVAVEEIAMRTTENARKLFNIV